MAVVPTPHTFVDDETLTTTLLNASITEILTFLLNLPTVQVRAGAATTLASSAYTSVTFGSEDLDDDPQGNSAHSTSSNTSRVTAQYAGWYLVSGGVAYLGSTTGARRGLRYAVNGSAVNGSNVRVPTTGTAVDMAVAGKALLVYLDVGDYVEIQGWYEGGGTLNTNTAADQQSTLTVLWARLAA